MYVQVVSMNWIPSAFCQRGVGGKSVWIVCASLHCEVDPLCILLERGLGEICLEPLCGGAERGLL